MKSRLMILLGALVGVSLIGAGYLFYVAGVLDFELRRNLPTLSRAEAKKYGVFAGDLIPSQRDFEVGESRWKIEDAWLEHRSGPERLSPFHTRQIIYHDLVICIRLVRTNTDPRFTLTAISLKSAQVPHIHYISKNDVFYSEIGVKVPGSVTFRSDARDREVTINLQRQN